MRSFLRNDWTKLAALGVMLLSYVLRMGSLWGTQQAAIAQTTIDIQRLTDSLKPLLAQVQLLAQEVHETHQWQVAHERMHQHLRAERDDAD